MLVDHVFAIALHQPAIRSYREHCKELTYLMQTPLSQKLRVKTVDSMRMQWPFINRDTSGQQINAHPNRKEAVRIFQFTRNLL